MDLIYQILSYEIVEALGWTVLHALWQGIAAAGVFALLMNLGRKRSAQWRYRVGGLLLAGLFIVSIITFFSLYEAPATTTGEEITQLSPTWISVWAEPGIVSDSTSSLEQSLPLVVAFWIFGAFVFLLRLLGGLAYLRRLRNVQVWTPDPRWVALTETLANQLGIRRGIELLESSLVSAPLALGHLKPLILFPIGALNQLSVEEVEAVLAHELAHISRHDFLFNLLQSLLEVLYYFHPAVWWISSRIRQERENCCDDLAIAQTGDTITYARALVRLEELRQPVPQLALAFSGKKNYLMERVRRILQQPRKSSTIMEKITVITLMLAAVMLLSFTQKGEFNSELSTAEVGLSLVDDIEFMASDTSDPIVRKHLVLDKDGEVVELELENEEVTDLSINGESVDPDSHQKLIEEIISDPDMEMVFGPEDASFIGTGSNNGFVWVEAKGDEEGNYFIDVSEGEGNHFEIIMGNGESHGFNFSDDEMIWVNEDGEGWSIGEGENWVFSSDDSEGRGFMRSHSFGGETFDFIFSDSIPEEVMHEMEREMEQMAREMEQMKRELAEEFERYSMEHEQEMEGMVHEIEAAAEEIRREARQMEEEAERMRDEMDEKDYEEYLEDQNEELEEMREEAEHMRAEAMEMAHEERQRFQEEQQEMHQELDEARRELAMEMTEMHRQLAEEMVHVRAEMVEEMAMAEAHRYEHNSFQAAMEAELRRDGFSEDGNYRFDLTSKRLKINGKKQASNIHKKYMDIYEHTTGDELCDDCQVSITRND